MNCFHHPTLAAVGVCKSCSKGLCPECAVDLGKGLACRGHCEDDVKALNDLLEQGVKRTKLNEHILSTARGNRYLGALFYLVSAVVFIGFAAYRLFTFGFQSTDFLSWGFGMALLLFGILAWQRAQKFPRAQ